MEEKVKGIVLSGINISENDKILKIFTIEKGTISAKIKGVKKAGAKLKFASEPFCFAEFILINRNEFYTVIGATLIDSFYSIREDIKKYYAGAVVLEFIKCFAKENIIATKLFLCAVETLKKISYEKDWAVALVKFLLVGLNCVGYALNFCNAGKIIDRAFFDYRTGTFFEATTQNAKEIKIDTFKTLYQTHQNEETQVDNSNALRLIDYYIEKKTDEKINSLQELIKIF